VCRAGLSVTSCNLLSLCVENGKKLLSRDQMGSAKPHDIFVTSGGNSCRKDVKNQTNQNLLHSASDQKLLNSTTSVLFGRGKGSAAYMARSSKNKSSLERGTVYDDRSSKSSVHVPADCQYSASSVKENWTAGLDGGHRTPYTDGVGSQRHSKKSKPKHRGNVREYSSNAIVNTQRSRIKNSSEEVHISEDWEAELFKSPPNEYNVTVTTDTPCTVVTTSDVEYSMAARSKKNWIICNICWTV